MCTTYEKHLSDNEGQHVAIPSNNPKLYNWVKNQRSQYQDYLQGKVTKLTMERVTKLNSIGFVWQVKMTWEDRFQELHRYFETHGNTVVSRSHRETRGLGEWLKKQVQLLYTLPRAQGDLDKVTKLLSVRLLFPKNELWKKVVVMLSGKGLREDATTLEEEFVSAMLGYLAMLMTEYQEGVKPSISREQAEQLQALLRIPRTSIDLKRRKKNNDAKAPVAAATYISPELPPMDLALLTATATSSSVTETKQTLSNPASELPRHSKSPVETQHPHAAASPSSPPPFSKSDQQAWDCFEDFQYCIENSDETAPAKSHPQPTDDDDSIGAISTSGSKPTKSHALFDWCPLMDINNQPALAERSLQVSIAPDLTKELCKYVHSNGLHTFFKDAVFSYNSDKLKKKMVVGTEGRTRFDNERRVFEYGKYRCAKPSWELVKAPSAYTDMVWVFPNDPLGHKDLEEILMENGFANVLAAIADHENGALEHLTILNMSFITTRRNSKLNFHLDFEPRLQGDAWMVVVPLHLVHKGSPELVVRPRCNSERNQYVKYEKHTAVVIGANQWHSSGLYEYRGGDKFRYCLCIAVCHITPDNVEDIVKSMEANYPLRSASYLLEDLATKPQWTSRGMSSPSSSGNDSGGVDSQVSNSSSKGSQSNDRKQKAIQLRGKSEQEAIELRGSSEERSSPSKPRRSPRRQVFQLPPPDTVEEDDGFEKLIQYCQRNRDKPVITWDNCVLQGKSFESLQDKEWLFDEVISGYYMLLQEQGLENKYFFHTMFAAQLVKDGTYTYENAQKYFGTKRRSHLRNIFMYDHLFFPINKGGSHWLLIHYSRKEELISVYDPWPRGKSPVWVDRITQYLSDEYERLYNNKKYAVALRDKLRGSAVYQTCPKQTNSWDCGVYVCLFGYCLAMDEQMNFSPEYVTKYRRTIAKCLLTKKLSM
jgi:hypothetical protein